MVLDPSLKSHLGRFVGDVKRELRACGARFLPLCGECGSFDEGFEHGAGVTECHSTANRPQTSPNRGLLLQHDVPAGRSQPVA